MAKKIVVVGLILLLVAYGGTEVWINNSAESAIANKLKQDHPEASKVQARVSIPVLMSILGNGKIRRVGASAEHVRVASVPVVGRLTGEGDIFASNVDVELSGVAIDKDALLQRKELRVDSIDHLDMTAEISQNEASKLLAIVPGVRFEFLPGPGGLSEATSGIHSELGSAGPAWGRRFSLPLRLRGTRSIYVAPLSKMTHVELSGAWQKAIEHADHRWQRINTSIRWGAPRLGIQVLLALVGGGLLYLLSGYLPKDARTRVAQQITDHETALASAMDAYDFTAVRYHSAQLEILDASGVARRSG